MTVIYTPKKPRYIVRENGEPYRGFDDLGFARNCADALQWDSPGNDYDVIDTQPGDDQ